MGEGDDEQRARHSQKGREVPFLCSRPHLAKRRRYCLPNNEQNACERKQSSIQEQTKQRGARDRACMREHATRLIVMECHRETRTHAFSTYLLRSPDCASSTSLRHVTQFEGAGTGHAAFQKADGVRAWRRTCRAGASVRTNRTHVSREHRRMSDIAMRTSPPWRVGLGRVASPSTSRSSFFN